MTQERKLASSGLSEMYNLRTKIPRSPKDMCCVITDNEGSMSLKNPSSVNFPRPITNEKTE